MNKTTEKINAEIPKFPDPQLPIWMDKGEPLQLSKISKKWWLHALSWLTYPLQQINLDTCDLEILDLVAYQRDIKRFTAEPESLYRLRIKHAFANAKDAGFKSGFERIWQRLELGNIAQLERTLNLKTDWDVILISINDEQLTKNNTLIMQLIRKYGRTCRRYFLTVINEEVAKISHSHFEHDAEYYHASNSGLAGYVYENLHTKSASITQSSEFFSAKVRN